MKPCARSAEKQKCETVYLEVFDRDRGAATLEEVQILVQNLNEQMDLRSHAVVGDLE